MPAMPEGGGKRGDHASTGCGDRSRCLIGRRMKPQSALTMPDEALISAPGSTTLAWTKLINN